MTRLIIDRLGQLAEQSPRAPLLADRQGEAWRRLTNARAWAASGAVASWLIAQGFGPNARNLSLEAGDGTDQATLLLGALRAGAVVGGASPALGLTWRNGRLVAAAGPYAGLTVAGLAAGSIDAAVAERRLQIDGNTPARLQNDVLVRHGDLLIMMQAVTLAAGASSICQTVDAGR